ncbi:alpha/beta hydrolase-fold protein [Gallaecimonas kandeliae]|uniref:alpha/beta hydrolase n=1 Tax=Gallaecimonas kandeliae TaxID=3029055 RepID=UPI0026496E75|nr:alpha/beta hydrolase-fold protein [Gallaecimonas kandeliae]WKE64581.1 alpha/beta hydrolase-fold protein [Gallaecimonas kandeliae]
MTRLRRFALILALLPLLAWAQPLVIGESFDIPSKVLGESRHINVFRPKAYGLADDAPLPVLYMPDGGIGEDFLHVAGLLQVSVMNGTMRPFLLVGIQNTQRRRDLTGPTTDPRDESIAPVVGGSQAFRDFIRTELMPEVRRRYPTRDETAIVGESLAGLFILETLVKEPSLFDDYIALDPSLWWNHEQLVAQAASVKALKGKHLFIATSGEPTILAPTEKLVTDWQKQAPQGLQWQYHHFPKERHQTIYHPAALLAFRAIFAPAPTATE